MVLHTVNKSPFEKSSLESCLRHALPGDCVLLIEDGVYAALAGTQLSQRMREALTVLEIRVLGPDLAARGIEPQRLLAGVDTVDYRGFVRLACRYQSVQAWL